jgi:FtsH-binding integral membrane protein
VAERRPGLRDVVLVGALVVGLVAVAVVVTSLLPAGGQFIVLRTPLLIVVLIAGTAGVLWRITRPDHRDR